MTSDGRLVAATVLACALALIALAHPSPAQPATPEAIRACVEQNLQRYSTPESAVVAQYSDIEASCIAALDGPGVSVQFTPEDEASAAEGVAPRSSSSSGAGSPATGPAAGTEDQSSPAAVPGAPAEFTPPRAGFDDGVAAARPDGTSAPPTAIAVQRAIAGEDADAGSTLPSSLADAPGWILALVGGFAGVVLAALAVRMRQRPR